MGVILAAALLIALALLLVPIVGRAAEGFRRPSPSGAGHRTGDAGADGAGLVGVGGGDRHGAAHDDHLGGADSDGNGGGDGDGCGGE